MNGKTNTRNILSEQLYTCHYKPSKVSPQFPFPHSLTCTEVMEPFWVVVILSCMVPMSVAKVG